MVKDRDQNDYILTIVLKISRKNIKI